MDTKTIDEMTPEALRIAVAKSNGDEPQIMWRVWYDAERQHGSICIPTRREAIERAATEEANAVRLGYIQDICISEPEEYDEWEYAPNYHGSRDALAPVLAKLTKEQGHEYIFQLAWILSVASFEMDCEDVFAIATATPEQCCRAYLKSIL